MENNETMKAVDAKEQVKFYFDTKVKGKVWTSGSTYRKLELHLLVKATDRESAKTLAEIEVKGWWEKNPHSVGKLDQVIANPLKSSIIAVIQ